jgi:hypothetical protein
VEHASRSSDLLHLKVSQVSVSQFTLKLAEERRRVVHIASSRRSCEDEVKDGRVDVMGYIKSFNPYFIIFVVLDTRDILIF